MDSTTKTIAIGALAAWTVIAASACSAEVEPPIGDEVVIGADRFPIQAINTSSALGNAHDFYSVQLAYSDTAYLVLEFPVPNHAGSVFPVLEEQVQVPNEGESTQLVNQVYGRVCAPDCLEAATTVDLLSNGEGSFLISGGLQAPQVAELDLTFAAVDITTEAYTDSSPKVQVRISQIVFPPL